MRVPTSAPELTEVSNLPPRLLVLAMTPNRVHSAFHECPRGQLEEIRKGHGPLCLASHEHIDVALRRNKFLGACRRSEHIEPSVAESPANCSQLVLLFPNQ